MTKVCHAPKGQYLRMFSFYFFKGGLHIRCSISNNHGHLAFSNLQKHFFKLIHHQLCVLRPACHARALLKLTPLRRDTDSVQTLSIADVLPTICCNGAAILVACDLHHIKLGLKVIFNTWKIPARQLVKL